MKESASYNLKIAELECEGAILSYDVFKESYELHMREAELSCFLETGNLSNLNYYLEESSVDEKRNNIFQTIWKKIKELFKKFKEALFGKRKQRKLPKDTKVETSKQSAFIIRNIKNAWAKVKSVLISGKEKLSRNGNWKKFLAVFGIASAGVALAAVFMNRSKNAGTTKPKIANSESPKDAVVTIGEAEEASKTCEDITDTIIGIAQKNEAKPEARDPEDAKEIQKIEKAMKPVVHNTQQILMIADTHTETREEEEQRIKEERKKHKRERLETKQKESAAGSLNFRPIVVSPDGTGYKIPNDIEDDFYNQFEDMSMEKLKNIYDKINRYVPDEQKRRFNRRANKHLKNNKKDMFAYDIMRIIRRNPSLYGYVVSSAEDILDEDELDAFLEGTLSPDEFMNAVAYSYNSGFIGDTTYDICMDAAEDYAMNVYLFRDI